MKLGFKIRINSLREIQTVLDEWDYDPDFRIIRHVQTGVKFQIGSDAEPARQLVEHFARVINPSVEMEQQLLKIGKTIPSLGDEALAAYWNGWKLLEMRADKARDEFEKLEKGPFVN